MVTKTLSESTTEKYNTAKYAKMITILIFE